MHLRIDVGNAVVMTLEMESVWRDGTVEQVMGRTRGAGARRSRCARESASDLAGILRRLSIWRKWRAWGFHPWLDWQCIDRARSFGQRRTADRSCASRQKETAVKKPISGGL